MNSNSNAVKKTEEIKKSNLKRKIIKLRRMQFENHRRRVFAFSILFFCLLLIAGLLSLLLFFRAKSNENLHRNNFSNISYEDHFIDQKPHSDNLVTTYATNDKAVLI